jgi:hypothetical protein
MEGKNSWKILQKDIKKALNFIRACGDEWTRTTDSRIFSPMLYQLSYITFPLKCCKGRYLNLSCKPF